MAGAAALTGEEEVKLLGSWASPYVLRAKIALNLKSVTYDYVEEDLKNKSELLLKSNPIYKKVPVLLHAGAAICESIIILEYIDSTWSSAPPILPADAQSRAAAKLLGMFIEDKFLSALKGWSMGLTEKVKSASLEELYSVLQILETSLGNTKTKTGGGAVFFGGEELGYVDIVLGSMLVWIMATEKVREMKVLDEKKTPLLVSWSERFCAHSAVKGLLPDLEKLIEYSMVNQPFWKAMAEAAIVAAGGVLSGSDV